jgi:hypothetical protein
MLSKMIKIPMKSYGVEVSIHALTVDVEYY